MSNPLEPTTISANGIKYWYLNGKEIDQLVFWVTTKERALTATEDYQLTQLIVK